MKRFLLVLVAMLALFGVLDTASVAGAAPKPKAPPITTLETHVGAEESFLPMSPAGPVKPIITSTDPGGGGYAQCHQWHDGMWQFMYHFGFRQWRWHVCQWSGNPAGWIYWDTYHTRSYVKDFGSVYSWYEHGAVFYWRYT